MKSIAIWINTTPCTINLELTHDYIYNTINYSDIYQNLANHFSKCLFIENYIKLINSNKTEKEALNLLFSQPYQKMMYNTINEEINKNFKNDYLNTNVIIPTLQNDIIELSLSMFKKFNPNVKTSLLNCNIYYDSKYADENIFKLYDFNDYEITKYYRHISPNTYKYEFFCILRWFIIRDYINSLQDKYDRIYIFDSDTLVCSDLNKIDFDVDNPTLSCCGCPAFTIINKNKLNELCDIMLNIYKVENNFKDFLKYCFTNLFQYELDNLLYRKSFILSDMLIFNYLLHVKKFFNIIQEPNPGLLIDKSYFKLDIEHEMEKLLSYINVKDNNIYLSHISDEFPCLGIHFSGRGKKYMIESYNKIISNC